MVAEAVDESLASGGSSVDLAADESNATVDVLLGVARSGARGASRTRN